MSHSKNIKQEYGALLVGGSPVSSTDNYSQLIAATTLTKADSGKVFYLNAAAEFQTTLPSPGDAPGFSAKFIVKSAPAGASYTIVSNGANISGLISISEVSSANTGAATLGTAITTISFVDGQAKAGDYITIQSDGNAYYVNGACGLQAGITFA